MLITNPSFILLFAWSAVHCAVVSLVLAGIIPQFRQRPHAFTAAPHRTSFLMRLLEHCIAFAATRRAWILVVVLVFGLLSGGLGAWLSTAPSGATLGQFPLETLTDALYDGAEQLTINGQISSDDSVFTRMARVSALAAVLLLAYESIQQLFAKTWLQWWISRRKKHVVICGLGKTGVAILTDLTQAQDPSTLRNRSDVIVIERDPHNPNIPWAEARGAAVVIGNAADEILLEQVRAHRAADVIFTSGSDELNLEGAYDLMRLINQHRKTSPKDLPRLFVHLCNLRLETMLAQAKKRALVPPQGEENKESESIHSDMRDRIIVRPFNALDGAIQALLDVEVLERRPKKLNEVAHFVIVGFGDVGQEVAVKIAQLAHYENLKRSRMTIVTSDKQAEEHFKSLYPKFFPNLESLKDKLNERSPDSPGYDPWMPFPALDDWAFGVHTVKQTLNDLERPGKMKEVIIADLSRGIEFAVNGGFCNVAGGVTSNEVIDQLINLAYRPGVRPMVLICNADDELNCADAVELRDILDSRLKSRNNDGNQAYTDPEEHRITILPYVPNRPMLQSLLAPPDKAGADLIPWGDCRVSCTYDALTTDLHRLLAQEIAHDYDLKEAQKEAKKENKQAPGRADICLKPLDAMTALNRHSNLMAAAHLNAKLAPLNLRAQSFKTGETTNYLNEQNIQCEISKTKPPPSSENTSSENTSSENTPSENTSTQIAPPPVHDQVARMEHHRWIAERLLLDWSFGDRNGKGTPENNCRTSLVDWENLLPTEAVKDQDQIGRILGFFKEEASETPPRFTLRSVEENSADQ
jgi:hypothetical protein